MPCGTSRVVSTTPATMSLASHSRRYDEIARSPGTQRNIATPPWPWSDTATAISPLGRTGASPTLGEGRIPLACPRCYARSACLRRLVAGGWRHVQGRVDAEEAERPEGEADPLDRHDRPVLRPWDVMAAQRVPKHDVGVLDRPVRLGPFREPRPAGMLVGVIPGGEPLARGERRHPQVL